MFPLIDDLLNEAVRTGFTPLAIRLGARQMRLLEDWASPQSSGSSEYDGLPVQLDPREDFRGLIAADDSMLTLPCVGPQQARMPEKRSKSP